MGVKFGRALEPAAPLNLFGPGPLSEACLILFEHGAPLGIPGRIAIVAQ